MGKTEKNGKKITQPSAKRRKYGMNKTYNTEHTVCAFNICLKTLELDEEAASMAYHHKGSEKPIRYSHTYAKSHSVKTLKRTQGYRAMR